MCLVLVIICTLFITSTVNVFASTGISVETPDGDISVIMLNNNSIYMGNGDTHAIMKVNETDSEIKYELIEGAEKKYLVYNKATNEMTSSITGQSISMDDILISDGICNEKEDDVTSSIIVPTAGNKIVKTYTYKVSYAKIASLVGDNYNTYDLAYTIVAIIGVFQGVTITTIAVLIYGALKGELLNKIVAGIKNNSSGGIKITIHLVEISKHQGGRIVKGYAYKIGQITTY